MTVGTTQLAPGDGRNYVINGAFDIWQRGTAVTCNSSTLTYTADRWYVRPNSSTPTTVTRSTDAPTGLFYSALITRDVGATGTLLRFGSPLSSQDIITLQGKTATISFWAKKDSGFTDTTVQLVLYVGNGTERARSISSYDNETASLNATFTLTSSWQKFTVTSSTLPDDISQFEPHFFLRFSGTAPNNDGVFFAGFQIEEGSVATPFKRNAPSLQGELAACQRYYQRIGSGGYQPICLMQSYNAAAGYGIYAFTTEMRVPPTRSVSSGTGFTVTDNDGTLVNSTSFSFNLNGTKTTQLYVTTNNAFASSAQPFQLYVQGGEYLEFDAEL